MKKFELEIIIRDEITERKNPKIYNQNLFAAWRATIELETIDLTNDSDTE